MVAQLTLVNMKVITLAPHLPLAGAPLAIVQYIFICH